MRRINRIVMIALAAAMIPAAAACDAYEDSLQAMLAGADRIEGWKRDGEHLIYYADELWEYINGAAEGFLAYEVKAVIVQDYVDSGGEGLKLEIYDHQTPLMGFGIYAQHRDPSLEFIEIGAEAFGDEYSIQFWKGSYYVKVNVFASSESVSRAMRLFAESVAEKIQYGAGPPAELAAFPPEGLTPRSIALFTEGVLGRSRFPSAFVGSYEADGDIGRLYLFPCGSEEQSADLFEWYAGEIGADVSELETDGFSFRSGMGKDPYHGEVAVFRAGTWTGIVTGFKASAEARRAVAMGAVDRIKGMQIPLAPPGQIKLAPVDKTGDKK